MNFGLPLNILHSDHSFWKVLVGKSDDDDCGGGVLNIPT